MKRGELRSFLGDTSLRFPVFRKRLRERLLPVAVLSFSKRYAILCSAPSFRIFGVGGSPPFDWEDLPPSSGRQGTVWRIKEREEPQKKREGGKSHLREGRRSAISLHLYEDKVRIPHQRESRDRSFSRNAGAGRAYLRNVRQCPSGESRKLPGESPLLLKKRCRAPWSKRGKILEREKVDS